MRDGTGIQTQAVLAPEPTSLASTHSVAQRPYGDLLMICGRAGAGRQLFLDPGRELSHCCPGGALPVYASLRQEGGRNLKLFLAGLIQNNAAEAFAVGSGPPSYVFLSSRR